MNGISRFFERNVYVKLSDGICRTEEMHMNIQFSLTLLIQHFEVCIIEVVLEKCLIHLTSIGYRLKSICLFKFHPTDSSLKIDGTLVSL